MSLNVAALPRIQVLRLTVVMVMNKKRWGKHPKEKIVLNTISVSHYVEKVRFIMDYAGIDYEEEQARMCSNIGTLKQVSPVSQKSN
jgi:hypothetical protein